MRVPSSPVFEVATPKPSSSFTEELKHLLNRHSQENASNTPDFVLAQYLTSCLEAFNVATAARSEWYKPYEEQPGQSVEVKG